jgi:peroxiredoxin
MSDDEQQNNEPAPERETALHVGSTAAEPEAQAAAVTVAPTLEPGGEPERGRPPIRLTSLQTILFAALAVFTLYITWRAKSLEKSIANRDDTSAIVSKPAPGFSLASLDGRTVSLSDYAGKKVVVSYWASWCGPCKLEMPELRDFYKQYHKADSDFEILAISIDQNRSDAEKYASAEKLPFPVLLDPESRTADKYAVEGIPTMFVVGKDGKVTYAHTGLDQAMQYRLMAQLGITLPGMEKSGDAKE